MATKRTVLWFRNDLRISDNPTLHAASVLARKDRSDLACVYCFDPRHFAATKYVAHKTGIYRSKFLIESVANLRENLRSIGSDLLVALARPEDILHHIAGTGDIFVQAEVTSEETAVERHVESKCTALHRIVGGSTLHHPDDLPYALNCKDLPAVFTNYRQQVEKLGVKVRPLFPALTKGSLPKSPSFASIAPTLAETPCGFDYLPSLAELGFSELERQAHTAAAASIDVSQSLRILSSIQTPASSSACTSATEPAVPEAVPAHSTTAALLPPPTPPPLMSAPEHASASESARVATMPNLAHPAGVMVFQGGESSARQRLQSWMFDGDHLKDYFDIRNGMLGEGYSTKLSPWLSLGCISPRHIYHESKRYERERGIANKSTYWLTFELLWRDYFRFYCVQHGAAAFYPYGPMSVIRTGAKQGINTGTGKSTDRSGRKPGDRQSGSGTGGDKPTTSASKAQMLSGAALRALQAQYKWTSRGHSEGAVARWKAGQTGQPLVDANMRELLLTGWMSNRGRQNVASYLVHDLQVDWRVGAAHFEELLLDHDVCSNYGNWNAAAGLSGEGKRVNKFNCVKQSKDYDPVGRYLRHWLPELRALPAPVIFSPTTHYLKQQQQGGKGVEVLGSTYGVRLGADYPLEASLLVENVGEDGKGGKQGNSKRYDSYALHCPTAVPSPSTTATATVAGALPTEQQPSSTSTTAGTTSSTGGSSGKAAGRRVRARKHVSEAGGKVQHD